MTQIHRYTLTNGLTLLIEPMRGVQSVGMTLLLPAGAAAEPAHQQGIGAVATEMLFRGAGDRDARQHSDALDLLGVHRSAEVQIHHLRLGARVLGDRLDQALPLLMDMVRRPQFPEEAFDPAQDLAVQSIDALEDEPQQKVMVELRRRHLPEPFGRSTLGVKEQVQALTNADVRAFFKSRFVPTGAILALAGQVDVDCVKEQVERLLGDWTGQAPEPVDAAPPPRGYHHLPQTSQQQHIGIAYDAVPETHEESMTQRIAVAALSGGMSGRLFTEVREKRGLCYSVYAAYAANRKRGMVVAYSGTTTERSAQTLDVLAAELRRLSDGIDQDEFDRAVVGLKARLVMQGESSGARASAIAHDQHILGRPRTLDEVARQIDQVTLARLNGFLTSHRPGAMTVLTIGSEPLETAASAHTSV